jgi:hypothetical protein
MTPQGEYRGGTLGFLATALACAISSGLTIITITVIVADALRSRYGTENLELRLYWIFGGTLAGVLLAAVAAWRLLDPITSTYRRGGLAIVAAFATVVLMLICTRIFELFGSYGLLFLLGLCGLMSVALAYRARRLRTQVQL